MTTITKHLCEELERNLSSAVTRVRLPAGGELLWKWFIDLNRTRTFHMAGPNPISYAEIGAYAAATGWPIGAHHIETLTAMDRVFLEHHAKLAASKPDGVKVLPPVSKVPLSAGLLDAMFG